MAATAGSRPRLLLLLAVAACFLAPAARAQALGRGECGIALCFLIDGGCTCSCMQCLSMGVAGGKPPHVMRQSVMPWHA
jgi:hypothetical protein